MALYGWRDAKMAQHYTRAANRARIAHDAAQLLLPAAQKPNENLPHLEPGEGMNGNFHAKSGA
jgi:hypothetical protein